MKRLETLLTTVLTVAAASSSASAAPILHEYVPRSSAGQRWAREGRLPDQLQFADRSLPKPADAKRRPTERVHDAKMDRETSVVPDRITTHDGRLRYTAEFNPSVVPFKRGAAFDRVEADYRLTVSDPTRHPIALQKRPTPPDRTPFWGSLVLRLEAGNTVPIPSVAPDAAIVSYETTPRATVTFYKDAADNFAISADRDGQLRIVFVTDAPHRYFSAEIPPLVTTAHVPASLRPQLPSGVASAAAQVHQHLGLRRDWTVQQLLDRLVPYFRNFRAGKLERSAGNNYLDIALSQRGVCRHRSWAFVITVQALGIPARYVHNEAHAFTEVFVPRLGWVRIDLGGASSELQVSNARDKAVHNPGPDPFPRPSRFARSYSQLTGDVSGLRRTQRIDQRTPGQRTPGRTQLSRYRGRQQPVAATSDPTVRSADPSVRAPATAAAGTAGADPAASSASAVSIDRPVQQATMISVRCNMTAAQRGEQVRVWGRVTDVDGNNAASLRVEIYLSRDGKLAEAMLGATVSDAKGRFDAKLTIPSHLEVGDYQLFAATPGDARHLPSLSR